MEAARIDAAKETRVNQDLKKLVLKTQDLPGKALGTTETDHILNLALAVLHEGDFQQRWEVAKIWPKLGKKSIAPLLTILADEEADVEIRWFVGRILGEFDDPQVIMALTNLLQVTEEEELSMMAASTLAKIGEGAIESLSKLLLEPSLRMTAVHSLAQIRHSQTILPLLTVIDDPNPQVRATVIEALGSFHDEHLVTFLLKGLKDPTARVRKEAVIALGMQHQFKKKFGLVEYLKPLLYDHDPQVCQQAIIALGRMADNSAAEALFILLKSPATPNMMKKEVIRALSWIETPQALVYLQEGLRWGNLKVCEEIISALGREQRPQLKTQATQILLNFIDSEQEATREPQIKQSVAMALGELRDPISVEVLENLTTDPDQGVRLHAIAALRKFSDVN
ncbi:PBS lyase HEAT domain protein repeat-containing protein [Rippkaea orientalis PCC 8801]|uniref:PBS lyase HEAT domain protein repeat-containing protein n=1 Tax=Rippkaea orientalis (strain PCC 8801 / RF-1) TaxID=41431 RepID=B7K3T9_RIPO1|nr:HEAT repeat domain-containing protein [Rippkaea orientalis]ACK66479.1 PBS lyase HEAT domain protein repeat-containing protein [Rippkaea orientalis PCC 8801]